MTSDDVLSGLRAVLDACTTAGVAHAVIGAVARNAWAPPRATTDADVAVIVDAEKYPALKEALRQRGITIRKEISADSDGAIPDLVLLEAPHSILRRVDLLVAGTAFEREAVQQAVERDIGLRCRVVRAEHLIVYKLIAGRPRDVDDVDAILRTLAGAGQELDLDLVRRWCVEWGVESRLDAALRALDDRKAPK